ncbi:MAG TPA: nitroreductase family protein [Anaerolineae bacterium]|jgi:nitroreductase|nr:nitroreductase family protein [Anaerolineae bacterium]
MNFFEAVEARHSIRQFDTARDVEHKLVKQMLRAAILAPSAGNRQPWRFIIVRRAGVKEALALAAFGQSFVSQAPVVIAVCAEPELSATRYGRRGTDLYCLQDTAAAIEHILLGAAALGLGTCWVGAFDEGQAAEALNLSDGLRPVALIPIGYPARAPADRRPRRSFDEVVDIIA